MSEIQHIYCLIRSAGYLALYYYGAPKGHCSFHHSLKVPLEAPYVALHGPSEGLIQLCIAL